MIIKLEKDNFSTGRANKQTEMVEVNGNKESIKKRQCQE